MPIKFLCGKQDNKIVHNFVFALTMAKHFNEISTALSEEGIPTESYSIAPIK